MFEDFIARAEFPEERTARQAHAHCNNGRCDARYALNLLDHARDRISQLYGELWDSHIIQLPEGKTKLRSRIEAAVAEEREACAQEADWYAERGPYDLNSREGGREIAEAIRARGK